MSAGTKARGKVNPSRVKLYIGGAPFEPSYAVEWQGGRLRYRARSGRGEEIEQEITPTFQQWESFWSVLHRAGIWDWKERYPNPGVCDGTMWSIEITHEGRSITSRGDNARPKTLGIVLEAVRGLLGGLPFN
jgi:hypothetical protein